MFVFISKSSFIYIEHFNITKEMFPLYFGVNFIFIIIMVRVNILLLKSWKIVDLVKMAFLVQFIDSLLFIYFCDGISLGLSMVFIGIYMASMAFIMGNISSLILEYFPTNTGMATSIMGVLQFGLASVISSLVLMIHSTNLYPIAIATSLISFITFVFIIYGIKSKN
jgi:DHA1 family bicyclomycin/chloramphenicol resistance-like MFS transporter